MQFDIQIQCYMVSKKIKQGRPPRKGAVRCDRRAMRGHHSVSYIQFEIYTAPLSPDFLDPYEDLQQRHFQLSFWTLVQTTAPLLPFFLVSSMKIYYSATFSLVFGAQYRQQRHFYLIFGPQYEYLLQRHLHLICLTLVSMKYQLGVICHRVESGLLASLGDQKIRFITIFFTGLV